MALEERHYVVRVTALLDRGTAAAAGDLVQHYDRAGRAAGRRLSDEERNAKRAQAAHEAAVRHVEGIKERHFREEQRRQEQAERRAEQVAAREAKAAERKAEQKARAEERSAERAAEAKQRSEERAQRYVERIRDRHFQSEQRRQEREERDTQRERKKQIKEIAGDAYDNLAGAVGAAAGIVGEVTGGLGVDFGLGSGVGKAVALEDAAIAIVNAGNRGEGSAQDRDREVGDLQKLARGVGMDYALDPSKVLGGLAQYQALTGDLDTAKAALPELAKLASAFGAELDDVVAAAGQVGAALGEVGEGKEFATSAEKAKVLVDVMKVATAQGQEGAIEIANLATGFAKLKAAGMRFEGNTAENITKMSALAQIAYQTGGAGSVREAVNAVSGFTNTLSTSARRKAFAKYGVEIDSATTPGAFKDPYEIIKEALKATKGETDPMKELFMNVVGEKGIAGLAGAYRGAGGGDKGLKAVDDYLAKFSGTVSDDVISENAARRMQSKSGQAQLTQNQIDEEYAKLSADLLPALRDLAPVALDLVRAFTKTVSWAADNPGLAITAAIVGSIGKAAIGSAIGSAIGKAFEGAAVGNVMSGALTKALGGLGGVGAIAGVTIAAATVYLAAKDFVDKSDAAGADIKNVVEKGGVDLVSKAQAQLAATGKIDKDTLDALASQRANLEGLRNVDNKTLGDGPLGYAAAAYASLTESPENKQRIAETEGQVQYAKENRAAIEALVAKMDAVLQGITKDKVQKGPIDVNIVGGAVVAQGTSGREGVGDQGG